MSKFSSLTMNSQDIGCMDYSVLVMSIREFIHDFLPETDLLPIHQRIDVSNYGTEDRNNKNPTKRQAIIGSIFKGIDISEMKINERTQEERLKFSEKYESIDGGNRKRAIRDFYNNKFRLNSNYNSDIGAKFYYELSDDEKNRFMNFKIRFVVYRKLTPMQKAHVWETTNNSTPVNHQEMMNGVGDIPVANMIRQFARTDNRLRSWNHPLFEVKYNKDNKIIGEWLSFDPTRLTYDRLVARIASVVHQNEKPSSCDDAEIEILYCDSKIDDNNIKSMEKKVKSCLDFIYTIAKEKRNTISHFAKITEDEFIILMRLYFTYKDRYDSFSIKDTREWYDYFRLAFSGLNKKNPSDYGLEMIDTYEKNSKEKKMRAALFSENLRKHRTLRWNDSVKWMEKYYLIPEELIERKILIVLDSRRKINRSDRELLLNKQRGLCYIDGNKLMLEDAEAGHIIPHSEGGSTSLDNIVMIRRIHNSKMGSMNVETYKEMYQRRSNV